MKWAFLLGSPDISGGSYVIFEHAIRAMNEGINVTVITEEKFEMSRLNWHPEAKLLTWMTYVEAKDIHFDICIATWWRTVFELHRVTASNYVYFVQSIESRFYSESEKPLRQLVESTYTLPLHFITEARWIQNYLRDVHNQNAHLVLNGIRKDIYRVDGEVHAPRVKGKLRVLVEGPVNVDFKNVPKTIELCKQSEADEIWLLTSSPVKSYPGVDRVFSQVPISETPVIYRSCDVIVKLSYVEGMFGPPLEMFHCGGTSITYDVTGHDEYIIEDYNGLIVKRDDEIGVIKAINKTKEVIMLDAMKENALETASNWPSWENSSQKFRLIIEQIMKSTNVEANQLEIQRKTTFLFDWYVIAEDYKNESRKPDTIKSTLKNYIKKKFPKLFNALKKIYYYFLVRKKV